jgi:hypothetical protein
MCFQRFLSSGGAAVEPERDYVIPIKPMAGVVIAHMVTALNVRFFIEPLEALGATIADNLEAPG